MELAVDWGMETTNMENIIRVHPTNNGYMAEWVGPHATEIERLFGTNVLPTAFTAKADPNAVMAGLRQINPGVAIFMVV